jgi:hypothetical protein
MIPMPEESAAAEVETLKLPDLIESVLDGDQIADLFRDIAALTTVREIIPKTGGRQEYVDETPAPLTLEAAREQLLAGAYRGLQIRYDYDGGQWWDTLIPVAEGTRIVRIRHDFDGK